MSKFIACLFIVSMGISSCDSADDPSPSEYNAILSNLATNVITATYDDLNDAAAELLDAVTGYAESSTQARLNAAQSAWVAAREPWEASEGFLFGPVISEGYNLALDTWPISKADLDDVMGRPVVLSVNYVSDLLGNEKGYHTIEFLLFGADGGKEPLDFTQREIAYLVAATQVLKNTTQALLDTWAVGGGNFGANLIDAGTTGSVYPSETVAMQLVVESLISLADDVANTKIETPLATQDAFSAESRFSRNSVNDFLHNIQSIRNVYTGDYGTVGGEGLAEFIARQDAALNERFAGELDIATAAIEAIPESFRDALVADPDAIVRAQVAVFAVHETLVERIRPLIR
ncbi:MAG: imelysin family protein [Bacteroidota bacterium]